MSLDVGAGSVKGRPADADDPSVAKRGCLRPSEEGYPAGAQSEGYPTARERVRAYLRRRSPGVDTRRTPGPGIAAESALLLLVLLLSHVAFRYPVVFWTDSDPVTQPGRHWTVAGCAVLAVLLRRWSPTLALLAVAAVFAWYPSCGAALAVTAFHASFRYTSARNLRAVMVLAAAIPLGSALTLSDLQWRPVLGTFGLGVVLCIVMPGMLATQLRQRDQLVTALQKQTQYLRRSHELADSRARLQERSRIAGEMHDILGHRLSLISLYAGALELDAARHEAVVAPAGTSPSHHSGGHDEARLIRVTVAGAMDELRRILGILRQGSHQSAPVRPAELLGDRADILDLVAQSQAAGVRVDLEWTGGDLDDAEPATRRAVHRIVREGLTNVHRHAAGADARVVVHLSPTRVRVEIVNVAPPEPGRATDCQGNGTAPPDRRSVAAVGGSGLIGVQERVRLLGGVFQARSTPEGGFRLVTDLPLRPVAVPAAGARPATAPQLDADVTSTAWRGRHRNRWAAATTASVLATGLCGIVASVNFAFLNVAYTWPDQDGMLGPVDELTIGMDRGEAMRKTGTGDPFIGAAAHGIEPTRPPRADCSYHIFGEPAGPEHDGRPSPPPLWPVTRLCFVDDRLVDIAGFAVPQPS